MSAGAKTVRAGGAFIEIFAKDSAVQKTLKRVQARLKAFASAARATGASVMAAGAGIVTPFLASAKAFASAGDMFDKMAGRTAMSVENLSTLAYAAELSGSGIESVEKASLKLTKTIGDAADGSATAADALGQLGFSVQQLQGMNADERFLAVGDALSKVGDDGTRTALTMELMGKSAVELANLFAGGAAGVRAMQTEADALGLTISTRQAQAAAALTDAWTRVTAVAGAMTRALGSVLADDLTAIFNIVAKNARAVKDWIDENRTLLRVVAMVGASVMALGGVILTAGLSASVLAAAVGGIGSVLGLAGAALGALVSPIGIAIAAVGGLTAAWLTFTDNGQASLDWLLSGFSAFAGDMQRMIGLVGQALAAGDITLAGRVLWTGLRAEFAGGIAYISGLWADVSFAASDAWDSLYYGVMHVLNFTGGIFRDFWSFIGAGFQKVCNFINKTFWNTFSMIAKSRLWLFEKITDLGYGLTGDDRLLGVYKHLAAARAKNDEFTEGQVSKGNEYFDTSSFIGDEEYQKRKAQLDAMEKQARTKRAEAYVIDLQSIQKAQEDAMNSYRDAQADVTNIPVEKRAALERTERNAQDAMASVAGKTRLTGTFSSSLSGMFGSRGGTEDRIAKASESTAKNTKKLLDQGKQGLSII